LCFADQRRGEEVGSVLLELTVAEQRFNAVMEVLRDEVLLDQAAHQQALRPAMVIVGDKGACGPRVRPAPR
jgi:hypothetical protein